ncbi:MAG: hypothetical protein HY735_14165 [Verrucomicrobia bacterium]|nr:hypothetical protein [Verrucomicrobiota bacterium]
MAKVHRPLVTHTFKGKRFEDHGVDLDALPDLYAYKELLVATAKELWKRHHPDRQRLPKNFEDSLCLKFNQVQPGSAAVPIYREVETDGQGEFCQANEPDELDEAVRLVAEAIQAGEADQPLPDQLPKIVIPLFDNYGKTLREDESFEQKPEGSPTVASYSRKSRERLLQFCAEGYTDRVDFTGEVRVVDLAGRFELRLQDGTKVPARFSPEQEAMITEALREHKSRRLRVKGTAEFSPDGKIKGVTAISTLTIQPAGEEPFDPNARPIWEIISEIGASVPEDEWEKVPTDAARNLDHYLYGHAKRSS